MKILMYRNDWGANTERQMQDEYGAVGYYRIINPSLHIKDHEVDVVGQSIGRKGETPEKKWSRIFQEYDVFWTTYITNAQEASHIFYHRDKYKKKVIIDLDDNFFDVSSNHPLYDKLKPGKRDRAFTATILSFADVITVSTEPLRQVMLEHMRKVFKLEKEIVVVPNMNDKSVWQYTPAKRDPTKVVIGYTGSNSHYDDMAMVLPSIVEVMQKYPHVYLEIMGSLSVKDALVLLANVPTSVTDRCDLVPSTWTFKEFPKHLSEQKWDIGIAPLVDTAFTRSKTHIKYLEYSMYKIPTIASRVYPYFMNTFGRDVITDGQNGLLVKPSEWVAALSDLIEHPEKRKQLGEAAYAHVTKNWQYDSHFADVMSKMLKAL